MQFNEKHIKLRKFVRIKDNTKESGTKLYNLGTYITN